MKHILVNLKRFDVPAELGGVNRLAPPAQWAETILTQVVDGLAAHDDLDVIFFLPELHLLPALAVRRGTLPIIGCQSVHQTDVTPGGNFGALTSQRPASAMRAAGVEAALVGHCEERAALRAMMEAAGVSDPNSAVSRTITARALAAQRAGLRTVVCIGETADERDDWRQALRQQVKALDGLEREQLLVAYEPVWAIGPGRTPPTSDQITEVAAFLAGLLPGVDIVYGGGLKLDNAAGLATIDDIAGGLIALTRFTGEIGFYPDEFLAIVDAYLN